MPRWIMTVLKSSPGYSGTMVTYLLEVMNPAICPIMHRAQPSPIRGRDSNEQLSLFSDLVGLAGKEAIRGEPEVNDCIFNCGADVKSRS